MHHSVELLFRTNNKFLKLAITLVFVCKFSIFNTTNVCCIIKKEMVA